ncbi:MAG TPA: hypothetical protein VD737_09480 [Steroidobacteraceae bacterium]|nr:hypothetical protein [Steroidobacteraceae bacterium]
MDQIATADLLELLLMQRDSIDLQFQFWLTITFAAIAAGHVAGPRLQYGLRALITGLYVLASAHIALRWSYDGAVGSRWAAELVRRGVDIGVPWAAVYLRTGLMLLGTVSAAVFLMRRPRGLARSVPASGVISKPDDRLDDNQ